MFVFEAPIDMLSYITINNDDWQEQNYVCLGGVAIDALTNILNNNKQITTVHLCVDNDVAGDKTVRRIGDELTENGVLWDRITPKLKDWNEDLVELCEQKNEIKLEM